MVIGEKRKREDEFPLPKFRRGYGWTRTDERISPAALYTEHAEPLPKPPDHLFHDPQIRAALKVHADHVKVETPFNVDAFEKLCKGHPNPEFVASVMWGLRNGFWPFDKGEWDPRDDDNGMENCVFEERDEEVMRSHRDKEVGNGRWSSAFRKEDMMPGMKISPMFVTWQKGKPRVITDHARSGLNDGIAKEDAKVRYDDMRDFGQCLHNVREQHPGEEFVLFKDDVASAFLNLAAHPIWQLRQVCTVGLGHHIVRRLVFGSRASPRIWCSVSGLICWVAIKRFHIDGLHVYMDDYFGWEFKRNMVLFNNVLRPKRQVELLRLWDAIGCPYDDPKQQWGEQLKIIGFWVDANNGTISLTEQSIIELVEVINFFLEKRTQPLSSWNSLKGHLNWLLNVLPWARPALCELYRKTAGKTVNRLHIPLNEPVKSDLHWILDVIPKAIGVRFVDEGVWEDGDADVEVWTDANLKDGLAFVVGKMGHVYQLAEGTDQDIFYLELVAIMCAIAHFAGWTTPPKRILLHTDNLDSVQSLNSLRATQTRHNVVLMGIASLILRSGMDIRVRHIAGKKNVAADYLSRLMFDQFASTFPDYRVRLFQPPRELLPARWRETF